MSKPKMPKLSPGAIAKAIVFLRAQGDHKAADFLQSHLPPHSGPLPHLDLDGGPGEAGDEQQPSFPNGEGGDGGKVALPMHGVPHPTNSAGAGSLPPKITKAFDPTSPLDHLNEYQFSQDDEPDRKFGCVMLRLPPDAADRILALGRMIPDADLTDDGREEFPHVTALYGIHSDDPLPVYRVLEHFRPVRVKLGNVSVFPGEEYDVVKVDVESESLHRMNAALRSLPHTNKYRDYKPHATIAYVRPGLGAVYAARFGNLDLPCVADMATFSDAAKNKHHVPLGRMVKIDKAAMSYLATGSGGALVGPAGGHAKPVKLKRRKRMLRVCKAALAEVGGESVDFFSPNGDRIETAFDAEEFVFGKADDLDDVKKKDDWPVMIDKSFDESAISREKSEHDGKRPGEFAPKGKGEPDVQPDEPDAGKPVAKSPKKKTPKLTDEQRDALRELANLFPDGLPAGLIDAKGRIDRDAAFPDEAATKKRIAKLREQWDATDAKITSLIDEDAKATERADADSELNDKINDELCGDDTAVSGGEFLDRDTDAATYDAIDAVENATIALSDGPLPEFDDAPDLDAYTEDDFPEEDDDPDTLDDQEDGAKEAVKAIKGRLKEAEADAKSHADDVTKVSAEWRKVTAELIAGVQDAAEAALAIPAEKYHAASKSREEEPDEYDSADIDDTLARVKLLRDRAKAILAEMK